MSGNFYVYRYIRLDTNTPFYVGKGKGKRAFSIKTHNDFCRKIAYKHGYDVEILLNDLTEKEAFKKEVEFIKLYKSLGYCEANLTLGGEGWAGLKHSAESREKISNSLKGRKQTEEERMAHSISLKGKKKSLETKQKLSNALKGRTAWNKGLTKNTDERMKKVSISNKGKLSKQKGKKLGSYSFSRCENISKSLKNKYACGYISHRLGTKHSKEICEKMKTNHWSKNGKSAWNKGLTKKIDERVKRNGEATSRGKRLKTSKVESNE